MVFKKLSRRRFVGLGTAAAGAGILGLNGRSAWGEPLGLPLGLQLYSVREQLGKDYLGTLKQLAALGYKEVEAAGFYNHSPDEVKTAMSTAGLSLVSAHYSANDLGKSFDETVAFGKALGLQYIICSFPASRTLPVFRAVRIAPKWKASPWRTIAGMQSASINGG